MKFHQKKTLVLKVLDSLPNKLGYYLYHKIQKKSFKDITKNIKANNNSYSVVKHILNTINIDLKDKNIIEIGSGWLPLMPYLIKIKKNCKTIYTYDLNNHYNAKNIEKLNTYFKTEENITFKTQTKGNFNLPDFIKYYPKTNISNANLPKEVSFVYSRFVLEHVQPQDIIEMHRKFHLDLPENVYVLHLISPSDHRAYSDSSISYYDFLKYSNKQWNNIQTKFDYHNRLRLPHYINIFEQAGFEVVFLEYDKVAKDSLKYKKFKSLNLHQDFKHFPEEEILAGSINVLLKKKL